MRTRKELMVAGHCALCGKIEHTQDCLLRDPGVTAVRMMAVRAKVVLCGPRTSDGKLHWTSGGSGLTYDIERRGTGRDVWWVMHERSTGKAIFDNARLRDIRQYIVDNQGVL